MTPEQQDQFNKFGCASQCVIMLSECHQKPLSQDEFAARFDKYFPSPDRRYGQISTSGIIDICRDLGLCSFAQSLRCLDRIREFLQKSQASGIFMFTDRDFNNPQACVYHCSLLLDHTDAGWTFVTAFRVESESVLMP